jgi:hypothetical protein
MSVPESNSDVEKSGTPDAVNEVREQDENSSRFLTGLPLYSILVGLGLSLFLGAMDMALLGTVSPSFPFC